MARKTADVTCSHEGRDKGKTFRITEMPASQAEDWLFRAMSAMARGNPDIPPETINLGWGAITFAGLRAVLSAPYEDVRPIVLEMMDCVQRVEETGARPLLETDTEEVATRLWLRDEVLKLHANFSVVGAVQTIQRIISAETELKNDSSSTQMSSGESDT